MTTPLNIDDIDVCPNALADQNVVITGVHEDLTRKQVQELVEKAGGKVTASVTSKTHLLVAGEAAGSKLAKAKELDVTVVDRDGLLQRIDNSDFLFDPAESDDHVQIGYQEWAEIDPNHGGEIWITQECADAFDWDIYEDIEYEFDDDGNVDEDYKEEYEKGLKYKVIVSQVSSVVNHKGVELRFGYEDEDVYALNDFTKEMLDHPGAEIMGWCDG